MAVSNLVVRAGVGAWTTIGNLIGRGLIGATPVSFAPTISATSTVTASIRTPNDPITVTVSIAAGTDDGDITSGPTFNNTRIDVRGFGFSENTFLRFTGVAVPQGATITAATITFKDTGSGISGTCAAFIQASDVDDGVMPTNTTTAASIAAAVTTASAAWTLPARSAGATQTTPDVAAVVQEVVDRAGWASGNAIVFVFNPDDSQSVDFDMRKYASYEHATLDPAQLSVTYSTVAAVSFAPTITSTSTVSATLRSVPRLVPTVTASSSMSAALTTPAHLSANVAGASSVTVALRSTPRLAATITAASVVDISLGGPVHLPTTVVAASSVSVVLRTIPRLVPTVNATSSMMAALTTPAHLSAASTSASAVTATLRSTPRLTVAVAAASSVTAQLHTPAHLAAISSATSSVSASLTTPARLTPTIASAATVTAALRSTPRLALVSAVSSATVSIALRTTPRFVVTITGELLMTVSLTRPAVLASADMTLALVGNATMELEIQGAAAMLLTVGGD